jgi:3-hydroxy-9,10-secoandrosta-1,3,5(10)-triene-9,17-dione monooxygenase
VYLGGPPPGQNDRWLKDRDVTVVSPKKRKPDYIPSRTELVAAAKALGPRLRERATEAEDLRRLPDETIADIKAAGLHKYFTPARYGGYEMDWGTHVDISREIASACGSTGWISSVVLGHTWILGRFPPDAQEEFWPSHPDAIIATAFAGGGKMTETDGGFELNGQWKFSSGVDHADCAIVAAAVGEQDPRSEAPKIFRMALLMPGEYEIVDTWHAEGLKATGSKDIRVVGQFVPKHRTVLSDDITGAKAPGAVLHDSYIYGVEMMPYFFSLLIGPVLGTAHGAMNEYCEATRKRVGQMYGESIADQVPVQTRIGESRSELQGAEAMVNILLDRLHQAGSAGEELSGIERLDNRRNLAYAAKLCHQACDRLSGMMGISGQTGRSAVQRHFRDNRAMASHGGIQWDACMAPTGLLLLGRPTGDPKADIDLA